MLLRKIRIDAAVAGDWEKVRKVWLDLRGDEGAATRDGNQIRHIFEKGDDTLWITFYGWLLWWCFAKPRVRRHKDGKAGNGVGLEEH